jgi:diguanylate cyclase (GGDEF)-like protein
MLVVLGGLTAIYLAHLAGMPVGPAEGFFERWFGLVIEIGAAVVCLSRAVLVREERRAWALVGAAVLSWGLGDAYWRSALYDLDQAPIPSAADAGWLILYPFAFVAICMLLRNRIEHVKATVWVDGVIGGLAVASVAAAVVFDAVLNNVGGAPALVATNLAYPICDMVLMALVVGAMNMSRGRLDSTWLWLGAGCAVFALSDSLYLFQTARGTYEPGGVLDAGWVVALVLIGFAAWRPASLTRRDSEMSESWHTVVTLCGFALMGLGVQVFDHFRPVNSLAMALSVLAMLAVLTRLVLTFGQNLGMLASSRADATTDALTGLGNRRLLTHDLERMVESTADGERVLFSLFDLNGFKQYNDAYGHPAGDSLLVRLSANLRDAVAGVGVAYRMGGDEFCILVPLGDRNPDRIAAVAAAALAEVGEGFAISCAYGAVVLPDEAADAEGAVALADRRMYLDKDGGRTSATSQSRDVLLQALLERNPALGAHLGDVGLLAEATAIELGLGEESVSQARIAAELHDVGKVAIPDAILNKPGPLDESEWAFVRRHSEVGERIIAAAPALADIAVLVRATHERWDGHGYPDGLAATAIPLGARIVAVCDAYDAMISKRPYQVGITSAAAVSELHACAGAQFDPDVVHAFTTVVTNRDRGRGVDRAETVSVT